jgi:hypothetical protein
MTDLLNVGHVLLQLVDLCLIIPQPLLLILPGISQGSQSSIQICLLQLILCLSQSAFQFCQQVAVNVLNSIWTAVIE